MHSSLRKTEPAFSSTTQANALPVDQAQLENYGQRLAAASGRGAAQIREVAPHLSPPLLDYARDMQGPDGEAEYLPVVHRPSSRLVALRLEADFVCTDGTQTRYCVL